MKANLALVTRCAPSFFSATCSLYVIFIFFTQNSLFRKKNFSEKNICLRHFFLNFFSPTLFKFPIFSKKIFRGNAEIASGKEGGCGVCRVRAGVFVSKNQKSACAKKKIKVVFMHKNDICAISAKPFLFFKKINAEKGSEYRKVQPIGKGCRSGLRLVAKRVKLLKPSIAG
jgi:hypothetical protein